MMLPDNRYNTLVGYILGYNAATDSRLLRGFGEWVERRYLDRESSLHWSILVAATHAPELLDERTHYEDVITDAKEDAFCQELLNALEGFLREKKEGVEA